MSEDAASNPLIRVIADAIMYLDGVRDYLLDAYSADNLEKAKLSIAEALECLHKAHQELILDPGDPDF